jgi:regulator of replication initiation timing
MTEPDPVAALAAELAELRGQLARTQGEVGALREHLKTESGQTMMLRLEVKKLTRRLKEAMETHALETVQAPYWAGLSREDLDAQLAELREWVEFLRVHYPGYVARLPRCWPAHGEAVWELSTLAAEWERIYGDAENRDLASALAWHDRFLPGVLTRLAAAIKCDETGCRVAALR